ncbi:MAG: hypothetical protein LBI03_03580, partial [Clostridiales bacterium]|nr:hypothetical protein [Clostridiales bacterium]
MTKNNIWASIKIACLYITTIIGAGFASGREIMTYFTSYKLYGIFGLVLASALIGIVGAFALEKVYEKNCDDYKGFLQIVVGKKTGNILFFVVIAFMFCFYSIMMAGMTKLFTSTYSLSWPVSVFILSAVVLAVTLPGIKKLTLFCSILTPIVAIGLCFAAVYGAVLSSTEVSAGFNSKVFLPGNWFVASVVYMGYNCLTSTSVLCQTLPMLKSKKTALLSGLLGGFGICVIALIVNISMMINFVKIKGVEMPLAELALKIGDFGEKIFPIILILAMFSSAVTALIGFSSAI